jgi:hypothetical protein
MSNLISATLSTADKNIIKANITAIKAIVAFLKNLTPADRRKIFKMGSKREGFVKTVLTAIQNQPAAVPSSFSVSEFEKDYQLYRDLREVWMELISLTEGLEDTLLLLGSELMSQATQGYRYVKQAAKGNMAVDTLAAEMGVSFKRPKKIQPTAHSLPSKEQVTLKGIVPKRLFRTFNNVSLLLYRGDAVSGNGVLVDGNSKFFIPAGWTTITVVNNTSQQSLFALIQK